MPEPTDVDSPSEPHPLDPWAVLYATAMAAAVVAGLSVHARHTTELHWLWPVGLAVVGVAFLASIVRKARA
ncbi:MAG TPA: hypothetical protein VGM93_04840 [Acidimicrobiales bacterium]